MFLNFYIENRLTSSGKHTDNQINNLQNKTLH